MDQVLDSLHFEETTDEHELPSVALPHTPEKLTTVPLAVLIFYGVSGGPFGVEASVRSGGHFFALLGFLLMPLVWSVPEALMTAELGSAFPEASGGVAWVEEAFGAQAGWLSGYFGWVSGMERNAAMQNVLIICMQQQYQQQQLPLLCSTHVHCMTQ